MQGEGGHQEAMSTSTGRMPMAVRRQKTVNRVPVDRAMLTD